MNLDLATTTGYIRERTLARPERHLPRPRVLLVDDLPAIRESLGRLLRRQGFAVVLAENGRLASECVRCERFDLVLLDLSMPEMDGWEALKAISKVRPEIPIVVMTAHPDQRHWVEPLGARALLEKPLDIGALLSTVRELVGHPQQISRTPSVGVTDQFRHHWHQPSSLFSIRPIHSGLCD